MASKISPEERRLRSQEHAIKSWKLKLSNDRSGAAKIVDVVIEKLSKQNLYHYSELAKFKANMMNGCAHPGDFGVNDANGAPKRA